jgi:hypothetical protein
MFESVFIELLCHLIDSFSYHILSYTYILYLAVRLYTNL